MKTLLMTILFIIVAISQTVRAESCFQKKTILENNEIELINHIGKKAQGYKTRGHVDGVVLEVTENRQGHLHFIVDLDADISTNHDRIEFVYNQKFGEIFDLRPGLMVRGCGDFVIDPYSPTKAVLHWLHGNPYKKKNNHEDGFLIIEDKIFGLLY